MKYKYLILLILIAGVSLIGLYFGCAGWNSDQSNQYDVIKKLIPNTTLFGRFNGGEIGRFVNNGQNQAGIDLLSVLLLYNTK